MSKENGGPAFPCEQHEAQNGEWNQSFEPGMTLRDYFAAKAMQTLIQAMENPAPRGVAEWAYRHADAMLAERSKP